MKEKSSLRQLFAVYLSLMVLLGITVGATFLHLGANTAITVSLSVATAKAILVLLYFMNLKYETSSLRLFFVGALLWAVILVTLVSTDYLTRGMTGVLGK